MSSIPNPVAVPDQRQTPPGATRQKSDEVRQMLHLHLKKTAAFIKVLDLLLLAFLWLAGLIVIWLVACVFDHWLLPLSPAGRWLFWCIGVGGSLWWTLRYLVPLLLRRINPVYAAKRIEHLLPDFKNGLISWLELEAIPDNGVPRGVMSAITYRAARFIGGQDPSSTVDTSSLIKSLGGLLLLTCGLVAYTMLSPKSVLATGERILMPWRDLAAPTRVDILAVEPGNVELTQGKPLQINVEVKGLRNGEPVVVRTSSLDGQIRDKKTELEANSQGFRYSGQVATDGSGIEHPLKYWIEAGDATSGPYRVTLSPLPSVVLESIELNFPAYTRLPTRKVASDKVEAVEGTTATIVARANQTLTRGRLEINPQLDQRGELLRAGGLAAMNVDGRQLSGQWLMQLNEAKDNPTQVAYRIRGYNQRGDANPQPIVHSLSVLADLGPEITLVGPKDRLVRVRPGTKLNVEARASDPDYGLSKLELKTTRNSLPGPTITLLESEGITGRQVKTLQIDLDQWKATAGDKFQLVAIAADNRHDPQTGLPNANVAQSQVLTLQVVGPEEVPDVPQEPAAPNATPPAFDVNDNPPNDGSGEQPDAPNQPGDQIEQATRGNEGQPNKERSRVSEAQSDSSAQPKRDDSAGKNSDSENSAGNNSSEQSGSQSGSGSGQDSTSGKQQDSGQQGSGEQGSGQQGSGNQGSGQQSPGEHSSGNQGAGQRSSGQQSSGQQSSGSQGAGEQGSGQQSSGQQSSGNNGSGQQNSGQQRTDQRGSGQESSGKQTAGNQKNSSSNGNQSARSDSPNVNQGSADNRGGPSQRSPNDGAASQGYSGNRSQSGSSQASQSDPAKDAEAFKRAEEFRKEQSAQKKQSKSEPSSGGQPTSSQTGDSEPSESQSSNSQPSSGQKNSSGSAQPQQQQQPGGTAGDQANKPSDNASQPDAGQSQESSGNSQADQNGAPSNQNASADQNNSTKPQQDSSGNSGAKQNDPAAQNAKGEAGQNKSAQSDQPPGGEKQDSKNGDPSSSKSSDSNGSQSGQTSSNSGSDSMGGASPESTPSAGQQKPGDSASNQWKSQSAKEPSETPPSSGQQSSNPPSSDSGSKGKSGSQAGQQNEQSPGKQSQGNQSQGNQSPGQQGGQPGSKSESSSDPNSSAGGDQSQEPKNDGQQGQSQSGEKPTANNSENQKSGAQNSESPSQQSQNSQPQNSQSQGSQSQSSQSQSSKSNSSQSSGTSSSGSAAAGSSSQQSGNAASRAQSGEGGSTATRDEVNREFTDETTQMTLDYLNRQKDQPDPELLRKLDWTKEDLNQFVNRWNQARDLSRSSDPKDRLKWQEMLQELNMAAADEGVKKWQTTDDSFRQMQDSGNRQQVPQSLRKQYEDYLKAIQNTRQ